MLNSSFQATRVYLKMKFLPLCLLMFTFYGCSGEAGKSRTDAVRSTLSPHVESLLAAGENALQQGNLPQTLRLADSVASYAPQFALPYFLRGEVYARRNQWPLAKSAFQQVQSLDPGYPGIDEKLGDVTIKLSEPDESLQLYHKAVQQQPTATLYEKLGRTYTQIGRADSAIWAYQQALAIDSTNATVFLLYGQLYEQLGHLDKALLYSRKALALEPGHPNYQFAVGAQLFLANQIEEAIPYLQSAADEQYLHYPAQYQTGQALLRLARTEEAGIYFTRADSARVLIDQINLTQQAMARAPGQPALVASLGNLYRRADMHEQATAYFEATLRMEPGNLDAQLGLAKLAMAQGNTDDAIRKLKLIVFEDNKKVAAWLTLGLAHATAGNCTEAKEAWETVVILQPGNAQAQSYLTGLCTFASE